MVYLVMALPMNTPVQFVQAVGDGSEPRFIRNCRAHTSNIPYQECFGTVLFSPKLASRSAKVRRVANGRLTSVRTSGTSLGGGLADRQRRHVLRELQRGPRPRLHLFLHCFLVFAQDAPALGGPAPVAGSHIQEYDDLPGLESAAMQVPANQFLNESIELRQDFIAVWFLHISL
jgi:hypothetical protein